MKHKGNVNYTRRDLQTMKKMTLANKHSFKPMSTRKLANVVAKVLNRSTIGVYYKLLGMSTKRTRIQPVVKQTTDAPVLRKTVTFSKPTKIEISEAGMTFYF